MVRSRWGRVLRSLVFAAFVGVIVLAGNLYWLTRDPWVALKTKVIDAARASPGTVFDFGTATDFAWDTMHVFEPYSGAKQADEQLGITWFEGDELRGLSLLFESKQALVFVANGRVVADLSVGRELIAPGRGVPRAKARFVVENGSLRWLGPD